MVVVVLLSCWWMIALLCLDLRVLLINGFVEVVVVWWCVQAIDVHSFWLVGWLVDWLIDMTSCARAHLAQAQAQRSLALQS